MKKKVSLLLVLTMLFSMFSFSYVANAADFESNNQKAYVEIPLTNVSDTDTKVEFVFNVNSSSAQQIDLYAMDDALTNGVTWTNAPNNKQSESGFNADKVGSVVVKDAKEYAIDVTDYVKAKKASGKEKLTFGLSGNIRNGLTTDFSTWTGVNVITSSKNFSYGTEGNAIRGGQTGTTSATIVTNEDHTANDTTSGYGKSLRLIKSSTSSTYRYKFYNGLKSEGPLDATDVGRKFEVSFWVKNNSDTALNMAVGFMSAAAGAGTAENPTGKATNFVGTTCSVTSTKAEGWVKHSFTYEVTQDTVDYQAGMLTFGNAFLDVYIDDVSVKDISTPVTNITASDITYAPVFENLTTEDYYRRAESSITTNNIYHTSTHAYRCGNTGGAAITVTDAANYPNGTSGKALRVTGNTESSTGGGRLKFYNAIKNSALTEDDIGRKFLIEAYVKMQYADSANISLCMMSEQGWSTYGATTTVTANKNDWTKISLEYTLDEGNITGQHGMPTFTIPNVLNYYFIDNFTVKEIVDGTTSKAPRLRITKSDGTVKYDVSTNVVCIEDGDNAYNVMNNSTININDKGVGLIKKEVQTLKSNWVGEFSANSDYGFEKTLRNNTDEPVNAILITALFDENDNMITANSCGDEIGIGEVCELATNIKLPNIDVTTGYYAKTLLWDGENMLPMGETKEYPVYYNPEEVVVKVYDVASGASYASFDVFVKGTKKTSNMYTMYKFQHINNERIEQDYTSGANVRQDATLYRVKTAFKAARTDEFTFTRGTQVLQEGEIEMAIREASSEYTNNKAPGDFIGGFHGDEHLTSVTLKIDGKEIPLNKAGNYVGKKIEFDQYSVVNRCNTPEEKLINHTKKYVVTKNGIDLNQIAEWIGPAKINVAYLTMFTIMRQPGANADRVTDYMKFYWSDGTEAAYYDVSNYGYNTYLETIEEKGQVAGEKFADYSYAPGDIDAKDDGTYVNKVHLWSKAGDIDAYVWTDTVRGLRNDFTNLTARIYGDNKIYFGSHESTYVEVGDVWEVNNHYDIKVNN
ncbi:MAG: hypothetical protein E7391_00285 [Ruminococcaceae bacterium]|nr:hypothetical protein [Oscillospiraceae bacterium]